MSTGKLFWSAVIALVWIGGDASAQAPVESDAPAAEAAPSERAPSAQAAPEEPAAGEPAPQATEPEPPPAAREEPPPPPEAPVRRIARSPQATCGARAREVAADAVVRVRSGDRWGAGFVYHSPRHVVTSFGLMARGRDVTVVARDGTHVAARMLAHDPAYDLAVLETTEPIPGAEPLSPAPETSATLGETVVAIGHPFAGAAALLGERGEGLLRWSIAQGTIGAVNEAGIQADVALSEGHAGGPLLDCEGRVLGMITGAGRLSPDLGLVARIARADALIEGAGPASDFLGNLRLSFGIGGVLSIDEDGRTAGGGYLKLAAILFDRVSWTNRVGLLMGGTDDPAADVLSLERRLVRIETLLGWRFFLDIGGFTTLYIVPSGGLTVSYDSLSTRSARVTEGCTPSAAESCIAITETSIDGWHVRPAVGLTFIAGSIELGYTLEIDVEDPVTTYHALVLGLLF